jgi:beta-glucosidase/6-phospho-beta-glucosidase/beta-galactosidase
MGWEIYPDGLRDFLLRVAREYSGDLADLYHRERHGQFRHPDRPDTERIAYLERHLPPCGRPSPKARPLRAISLVADGQLRMGLGYEKRFGLVHVDFESLARTPKASYQAFAQWWNGPTTRLTRKACPMTAPVPLVAGCRYRRHEHPRGACPWTAGRSLQRRALSQRRA